MEKLTHLGIAQKEDAVEMQMAEYRIKPMIVLVLPSWARS
jgi:hypothetical protein